MSAACKGFGLIPHTRQGGVIIALLVTWAWRSHLKRTEDALSSKGGRIGAMNPSSTSAGPTRKGTFPCPLPLTHTAAKSRPIPASSSLSSSSPPGPSAAPPPNVDGVRWSCVVYGCERVTVWIVRHEFQGGLHQTNMCVANNRSKFASKSKFRTWTIKTVA